MGVSANDIIIIFEAAYMESITLSDLAQRIKNALKNQLESSYWVVAEIGEMKVNARGHCYLELIEKEGQEVRAKLRAAIWAYDFRNIDQWFSRITGQPLREGIQILANAQVAFHEVYGLNLTIRDIDPKYTLGERERLRQEIIARLAQEGLLEKNKQLQLPLVPQRVAVVSSSTAAGYGDFCHHLQSNKDKYTVVCDLFQATMQGRDAAASIQQALQKIAMAPGRYDAIAIIRGGGAQMDLDAFNDYGVCAAIASSPYPVLTGIGHERDETIADLVAHTRLKTPTAVADFILEGFRSFAESVYWLAGRLQQAVGNEIARQKHFLDHCKKDLQYVTKQKLQKEEALLSDLKKMWGAGMKWQAEKQQIQLKDCTARIFGKAAEAMTEKMHQLRNLETRLTASDPTRILEKGYTITKIGGLNVLKARIEEKQVLETFFAGGKIESEVKRISKDEQ